MPAPGEPREPNTFDNLTRVRQDLGWRIGMAAREDDTEAIEVFTTLCDAIDAALAFHEARNEANGE